MKMLDGSLRFVGLKRPLQGNFSGNIRLDAVLVFAIVATWIVIFPRLVPDHSGDREIFVSVAERLLAGDTLYSGVWDNKDPLFYFLVAAERASGAWAELAAEAMLVGLSAASAYVIATTVASRWVAAAIAFVAVPIILTGEFYVPGLTHLPGIGLALAASAAAAKGRPALSGACLALLFFTKLIFMPVAVVAVGCFLLARRRPFEFITCVFVAGGTTLALVGLLAIRGELRPYMDTMVMNFFYSRGNLVGKKTGLALIVAHFNRLGIKALGSEVIFIALAITVALIPLHRLHHSVPMRMAVASASILTTLASLVVLSMTGLWLHHNQIMYIPAIFAALTLAPLLDLAATHARLPTIVVVALAAYFLGGSIGPRHLVHVFFRFPESYAALSELSPETERLLAIAPSGSYARLGGNDDGAHAIGLRQWKLACAMFQQYPIQDF